MDFVSEELESKAAIARQLAVELDVARELRRQGERGACVDRVEAVSMGLRVLSMDVLALIKWSELQ